MATVSFSTLRGSALRRIRRAMRSGSAVTMFLRDSGGRFSSQSVTLVPSDISGRGDAMQISGFGRFNGRGRNRQVTVNATDINWEAVDIAE